MRNAGLALAMMAITVTIGWAQEPPGWVPLGNLADMEEVRDIIEIPGTSILVACGRGWSYFNDVHRSTNGGQGWTKVLDGWSSNPTTQLARDSVSGRLWFVQSRSDSTTLYFSSDSGQTWTAVAGPSQDPAVSGNCIELNDVYLYLGGTIGSPYSISLYRLHQTNLTWGLVATYPECDAITQLRWHAGKLLVFCRDKDEDKVRVFTYTPGESDSGGVSVGEAEAFTPSSRR